MQLLLGAPERGWREAEEAVDRLAARFGRGSVRPARLLPEHRTDSERTPADASPGRATATPAPTPAPGADQGPPTSGDRLR